MDDDDDDARDAEALVNGTFSRTPFFGSARMRSTGKGDEGEDEEVVEEEEEEEVEDDNDAEEGMLWYARIISRKTDTSLSRMEK